jgi:hypothetical protein
VPITAYPSLDRPVPDIVPVVKDYLRNEREIFQKVRVFVFGFILGFLFIYFDRLFLDLCEFIFLSFSSFSSD